MFDRNTDATTTKKKIDGNSKAFDLVSITLLNSDTFFKRFKNLKFEKISCFCSEHPFVKCEPSKCVHISVFNVLSLHAMVNQK